MGFKKFFTLFQRLLFVVVRGSSWELGELANNHSA